MAQSIAQVVSGLGKKGPIPAGAIKKTLDQELQQLGDVIKEYILAEIELNSRHKLQEGGIKTTTKVSANADGLTIELPPYAESIDKGRKPGGKMVPLAVIIGWLKRYKISSPKAKKNGGVNSAAAAIQRSIFKSGIKAKPFIEAALAYRDELVERVVEEVMLPQIASSLELIFK